VTAEPVAPDVVPPALRDAILAWYGARGRPLAFRATRDPYAVLVSELMAQQTQAARAAEAWTAWMLRFPTVEALAAASAADVLRAWAGLGYNRRAIHLHRAAREIVDAHGGRVPDTVDRLTSLPGVGPYTARAVAAIAFSLPVGAVDTNVRRVLGRIIMAGDAAAVRPAAIQALADAAVPPDQAGDWTHALMDIGAGPCRPRRPNCRACPACSWCRFHREAGSGAEASRSPAARSPAGRAPRPSTPFPSTTRWLRGRILARARDAADGTWVVFHGPIGRHEEQAVGEAVAAMAAEGLLEMRLLEAGPEARLPSGGGDAP
jgi:A/G-specific adenine glycosylase